MKKFSDYSVEAEEAIRGYIPSLMERKPEGLYAPIAYSLTAGGKRLRPALLLMAAEAFGGEDALDKAKKAAVGLEMFHNFTLLHDDVMDNSDTRRGRPTVHAKWDTNTAILSGDAMLTLATELVSDVPDACLRPVLAAFNRGAMEVYDGQRYDMDFETRTDVTIDEYVEMIRLKTGALLGAACAVGAIIGGASEKDVEAMRSFGEMLGIAFQIQDDWLDTFGDSTTFGKPIGGDILNDKKTFLLINALSGQFGDTAALRSALELEGDIKVKTVTRIFAKMGLDEATRKAVNSYSSKAIKALKKVDIAPDSAEALRLLVEKLTGRKK